MTLRAPTAAALSYCYPRLVAGAAVVFDDYGDAKYRDQRSAIDRFFADREEGGSKMGPGIVLEAMLKVPALRLAAARGRL